MSRACRGLRNRFLRFEHGTIVSLVLKQTVEGARPSLDTQSWWIDLSMASARYAGIGVTFFAAFRNIIGSVASKVLACNAIGGPKNTGWSCVFSFPNCKSRVL